MSTRMYADTVTWNPLVGCRWACTYCKPSFQRYGRLQACKECQQWTPHEHPERLARISKAEMVFVCSMGDICFAAPQYMRWIIDAMRATNGAGRATRFMMQSKQPECFAPFLGDLPDSTLLVTTLETDCDAGYGKVSKAPLPSERWRQFCELDWPLKAITVEPMMAFDPVTFAAMIVEAQPRHVWIGFNSYPGAAPIPEPSELEVAELIGLWCKPPASRSARKSCAACRE